MSVSTLKFHPAPSSHAQAREKFAPSDDLERRLKSVVRGEVRFDAGTRALYATDSSNYRQVPIGLVVPLDEADVQATLAACREFGARSHWGQQEFMLARDLPALYPNLTAWKAQAARLDPDGKFANAHALEIGLRT